MLFPHSKEDFGSALNYVPGISNAFLNPEVYVLLPYGEQEGFSSSLEMYQVISPLKDDVKFFSLPKKRFLQKLRGYNFDICVDLDLNFNFFNAYVCLKTGALLRVGVKTERSTPFYNLQIALPKRAVYRDDVYFSMLETLKNLKTCEDNSCTFPS